MPARPGTPVASSGSYFCRCLCSPQPRGCAVLKGSGSVCQQGCLWFRCVRGTAVRMACAHPSHRCACQQPGRLLPHTFSSTLCGFQLDMVPLLCLP